MARQQATVTVSESTWEETPFREISDEVRLVQADSAQDYAGGLTGHGEVRYLMMYTGQGATLFSGLEYVTGSLGGNDGAFAIRWEGEDDGSATRARGTVIPGSGTGALTGLSGEASLEAARGSEISMTVSWEVP